MVYMYICMCARLIFKNPDLSHVGAKLFKVDQFPHDSYIWRTNNISMSLIEDSHLYIKFYSREMY